MAISDFDDQALEEAVLIKEATGATVTAVGLQADGIEDALRVAYARGADRVVIVDAGEIDPYDSRTAALAFAEAFRELAPDLVLVGVQTPYDVFGQTAPVLAVALGWPQANVVVGVTVDDGTARVVQEYAGGRLAVLGLRLPAVVGVQSASPPPRYVSMSPAAPGDDRGERRDARRQRRGAGRARRSSSRSPGRSRRPARRCSKATPSEVAAQIVAVLRERGALVS